MALDRKHTTSRIKQAAREQLKQILIDGTLDVCPSYSDPHALLEHAVAIMVKISKEAPPAVALDAAKFLFTYAQQLDRVQRDRMRPASEVRQELIQELRGLYQKALAEPTTKTIVLEESSV